MTYDKSKDWHKIAVEYKKEIEHLHNDILTAAYKLEDAIEYPTEDDEISEPLKILDAKDILFKSFTKSEKAVDEIERFN